ncbi:apolipoprotein N-acyltransferase [Ilumatobacter nonamiensis]|uniref:apolipoprotein N-acyltransferase n=1 Tax=Ilumatobacter nonamiensis TaxID=467093 RepID=UPI00034BEEAA|nr:apolipoprotein N-acyltransferase [Ilumatobacter nonamiensis]
MSPPSDAPRRQNLARGALALGAGVLVALSLPPWGFWPLALIGVVLFDVSLGADPTRRQRFAFGWLFGAGWMFIGMGWMIQLTGPGYIAAGVIFGGFHSVAAGLAPDGKWRVLGRPALHTLAEALRFSFPFGGVPLASMGMSQVGGPIAPVVTVGGVILITWVVFQLGTLASAALSARTVPTAWPGATLMWSLTAATVAVIGVAYVAPDGDSTGETLTIAAVQGGGEQGTSALDVPSRLVTERHLDATATIEPDPELDLVLWPENAIDVVTFETSDIAQQIVDEARRLDVPISVGLTEDVVIDGKRRYTNAQVVIAPDGEIVSRYDKVRRVPFGEYVPLRGVLERITSAVDRVGDAVPGTTPAILELPTGEQLSAVISWEVFFGGRVREGVELGGSAVINPTNGASYTGTIVQTQQVASSRLRAMETGRWVVQVAPTGFTAFVSPDGTVVERTSQREQKVLTHEIELRDGFTWYTSLGDAPFIVALLAAAIASMVLGGRFDWVRRRSPA